MNKNRIFAIFILFALLITCAGVSFASGDIDYYSMDDDLDDFSIDNNLDISDDDISDDDDLDDEDWEDYDDEDDLDDEDWEDYDDEDDLDDEDWEDYDDEDYLDDEDWDDWDDEDWDDEDYLDDEDWDDWDDEDWDDEDYLDDEDWDDEDWEYYYDNIDFIENVGYYPAKYYLYDGNDTNGTLGNHTIRKMVYYLYKCGYDTSSSKYYNETDEEENSTEEYYEIMYHDAMVLGASFIPSCGSSDMSNAPQNHYSPIETADYDFNDYQSVGDEQNTSESNEKHDAIKSIDLDNGSENNILALLLVLIVSILLII